MTAAAKYRLSVIPAGAVTDRRLKAGDIRVLALLGRHLDHMGWCRRSQVRMAEELGCSRGSVQGALDRLCASGWVERRLEGRGAVEPDPDKQPFAAHSYRVVLDRSDWPVDCNPSEGCQSEPDPEGGCQPVGTGGASPVARGANPGVARGANPGVAPLEGLSFELIPCEQDSPPFPPPGGGGASQTSEQEGKQAGSQGNESDGDEEFVAFWCDYPGHKVMDRERAYAVWLGLIPGKRKWAMYAAPKYAAELDKLKRKPIDAYKWLEGERFAEFPEARPVTSARIFAVYGGNEWRARAAIAKILGKTMPAPAAVGDGFGAVFRRGLPPDALAMAVWDDGPDAVQGPWLVVDKEEGLHQFAAWRDRIAAWTGEEPQAQRIDLGGEVEKKVGDRVYRLPHVKVGLLVPRSWPPAKGGA